MKKHILIASISLMLVTVFTNEIFSQDLSSAHQEWRAKGKRGYKGYVTLGIGTGSFEVRGIKDKNNLFAEVETVHGYQFNPWLYVGGGVSSQSFPSQDNFKASDDFTNSNLFAAIRFNFLNKRITPFIEGKVGTSIPYSGELADELKTWGGYFSPTLGCHFGITRRFGINLSAGFNFHSYSFDAYDENLSITSWVIRLGVDF